MTYLPRWLFLFVAGSFCFGSSYLAAGAGLSGRDAKDAKEKAPVLSLRASPMVGFAPTHVVLNAELRGGPDDYEELYCPAIEWEWGDGTRSESESDCEPYQAGKSEIRRHYIVEHVFDMAGNYRVLFRLKRKDRSLAAASVNIQVRPGLGGE